MPEVSKIERKGITYYIKDAVAREMLKQKYVMPNTGIPKQDLSEEVRILLNAAKTALQHYTETDPTVPNWAKQLHKPSYTAGEIEGLSIVAKTGTFVKNSAATWADASGIPSGWTVQTASS